MKVLDIFETDGPDRWTARIAQGDWGAAKFLAELLGENRFHAVLGEGTVYLLADGEKLVSFVTLTHQDCVDDRTLFPWLGFFYTFPEYRGRRCGGVLLDYVVKEAAKQGYPQVYLATDHVGLYEKYGFQYWQDRIDIYGDNSRLYVRKTEEV